MLLCFIVNYFVVKLIKKVYNINNLVFRGNQNDF